MSEMFYCIDDWKKEFDGQILASNEFHEKCKHLENYDRISSLLKSSVDFLARVGYKNGWI